MVSSGCTFLPPLTRFSEREEVPRETWDILSRATNYLILFNCPFPVPPSHFIFFLTLKRLLTEMLGLTTHPHRSSHQEPAGGQERGTCTEFDLWQHHSHTDSLPWSMSGHLERQGLSALRDREHAWHLKQLCFLLILKSVTLNQQWGQNRLNSPTIWKKSQK